MCQRIKVLNNHGDLMAESLFKAEIAGVGDEALEIRVGQQVLGSKHVCKHFFACILDIG